MLLFFVFFLFLLHLKTFFSKKKKKKIAIAAVLIFSEKSYDQIAYVLVIRFIIVQSFYLSYNSRLGLFAFVKKKNTIAAFRDDHWCISKMLRSNFNKALNIRQTLYELCIVIYRLPSRFLHTINISS